MTMIQVVQIPVEQWKRIERILIRLDKEQGSKPRAEWLTAAEFKTLSGKTPEQLRGLRNMHPEMVKPRPGCKTGARYLYNWTAYAGIYQA